jgi:hypothetical protein
VLNSFNLTFGSSAAAVFQAMLVAHGADAIPQLQQALDTLASKGMYPYQAVTPLMSHSAPQQRTKLFEAALSAYLQSKPGPHHWLARLLRTLPGSMQPCWSRDRLRLTTHNVPELW